MLDDLMIFPLRLFCASLVLSIMVSAPAVGEDGEEFPQPPYQTLLNPVHPVNRPGKAAIAFTVSKSESGCDTVILKIVTYGHLGYAGQTKQKIVLPVSGLYSKILNVDIAASDTCGLEANLECNGGDWRTGIYFISSADSIMAISDLPFPPGPVADSLTYPRGGHWEKGSGTTDSVYVLPERTIDPAKVRKVVRGYHSQSEREHERMRRLEQEPLTGATSQTINVDGEAWTRREGETKFHKVEVISDLAAHHKRRYDSLMAKNANRTYDIRLDLRSPEHLTYAKSIVDSLIPTDTSGVYRVVVTKAVLNKIADRGIPYSGWNQTPRKPPDSSAPLKKLNIKPDIGANVVSNELVHSQAINKTE